MPRNGQARWHRCISAAAEKCSIRIEGMGGTDKKWYETMSYYLIAVCVK